MEEKPMTRLSAGLAVLALTAVLGVTAWVVIGPGQQDKFSACRESQVAGGTAAIGGPFTLVNQDGQTVTETEVITKPALIYFGYTFCPDVCPLDNLRNAEAADILEEQGIEVTPVFITIDPARDTVDVMKDYVENMHPRMIGLTGSEAQVRAASQAFKTYYKAQPAEDEFYLVDHTTFTYLMLPETGFADFFRREVTADEMAARVSCFVELM
jgi:protein SCO1